MRIHFQWSHYVLEILSITNYGVIILGIDLFKTSVLLLGRNFYAAVIKVSFRRG